MIRFYPSVGANLTSGHNSYCFTFWHALEYFNLLISIIRLMAQIDIQHSIINVAPFRAIIIYQFYYENRICTVADVCVLNC